jgi:hypothetical protein
MRGFAAVVVALVVIALGLFVVGLVVCPLAFATESVPVAVVGCAVGLPFVFYIGYRAAKKVLAGAGD